MVAMISLGDKIFSVPLLPYKTIGIYAAHIHCKGLDHQNKEGNYSIWDNVDEPYGHCLK